MALQIISGHFANKKKLLAEEKMLNTHDVNRKKEDDENRRRAQEEKQEKLEAGLKYSGVIGSSGQASGGDEGLPDIHKRDHAQE
jgi:hypothetical protein